MDQDRNSPRVSIITPSFNQGRYLEETIRSVLLQDHPNIEYIVIDGGSNDESVNIIEQYDPWISYWISEPDHGQADAINKGFGRATGEYLCWLNSDDVFYQGFVSRRVAEFGTREKIDLIYGDVDAGWDGGERRLLRGEPLCFLDMLRTLRVSVPQQGAMWRRSTVEKLGGLDPRWRVVLDREFFLRIIHRGAAEYIPGLCGFFRQHDGAKSIAEATAWVTELPTMYEEFFADPDLEPSAKRLERETMATVHLLCSDILRTAGQWNGSLTHVAKAMSWQPSHAISSFFSARLAGLRRRLSSQPGSTGTRQEPL
jgi:glycosyltransferase involved in cell wall biosynthesis